VRSRISFFTYLDSMLDECAADVATSLSPVHPTFYVTYLRVEHLVYSLTSRNASLRHRHIVCQPRPAVLHRYPITRVPRDASVIRALRPHKIVVLTDDPDRHMEGASRALGPRASDHLVRGNFWCLPLPHLPHLSTRSALTHFTRFHQNSTHASSVHLHTAHLHCSFLRNNTRAVERPKHTNEHHPQTECFQMHTQQHTHVSF